jgi:hypothetical protein
MIMTGLKLILDRLGLKQSEFAKLLGVSPRTVSLWATGEVNLPGPVQAYVRMLQVAHPSVRSAEFKRLTGAHPVIDEGLYRLMYGPDGCGEAVAFVRQGRVVGSDRSGARFEGTYQFDSARRTNHFHGWLHIPPAGKTVTGLAAGEGGALVEVVADVCDPGPVASAKARIGGKSIELRLAYLGPLPGVG